MENECLHIEEMLAAFTLDALDVEEKIQVEAHLENCAACQLTLADYQTVGEGLMSAIPPAQPPARVRAQLLVKTAPKPQKSTWYEIWRTFFQQFAPIMVMATVLILVIFNIGLYRRSIQLVQTQEQMAQQNRSYQTAFALLTYPDSQVAMIDDGEIYGTMVYEPDHQVAFLNVWGLEDLPEGQAYQVWLIKSDETRISGGVFRSVEGMEYVSYVIESPTSIDSFTGIGVTIEPEGGSPGPTGARVFGIQL